MGLFTSALNSTTVDHGTSFFGKKIDDTVRLDTRGGDDKIHVHQNIDGSVEVTVNGKEKHYFTAEQAKDLVIRGGRGDDTITTSGYQLYGPETHISIGGGKGDDSISGDWGNRNLFGG